MLQFRKTSRSIDEKRKKKKYVLRSILIHARTLIISKAVITFVIITWFSLRKNQNLYIAFSVSIEAHVMIILADLQLL